MRASDPIRLRFRELLHAREISQKTLCERLSKRTGETWRMSRLSKILNGHIAFFVDDLILMAEEAGISLVEVVREPGREFVADLSPTELRLIHALRDHPAIMKPLADVVATLTPARKPSRAIVRERMRRARSEDESGR